MRTRIYFTHLFGVNYVSLYIEILVYFSFMGISVNIMTSKDVLMTYLDR